MSLKPGFAISKERRQFWSMHYVDTFREGMRKAGLPE
jgi:hypothetical protein